jgi:hypothetical protein
MTVGCNAMELARRCETINLLKFNHERPVDESALRKQLLETTFGCA